MTRRSYRIAGLAAVAGAILLAAPLTGQAQSRWGVGMGRGGIYGGSYNAPYYGSYGNGWYGNGWNRSAWVGNYNYPWGYNSNYGYGYYPSYSYGRSWYSPNYYGQGYNYYGYGDNYYMGDTTSNYSYPSLGSYSMPATDEGYYGTGYGSNGYSYGNMSDNRAHVTLRVPADAEVWFEGVRTRQGGTVRNYVSPPLDPNRTYRYDIRAEWRENGQEVSQERHVKVGANTDRTVNFAGGNQSEETTEDMRGDTGNRSLRNFDLNRDNYDRNAPNYRRPLDRDLNSDRTLPRDRNTLPGGTPPSGTDRTTPLDRNITPDTTTPNRTEGRTTGQPPANTTNPSGQPPANRDGTGTRSTAPGKATPPAGSSGSSTGGTTGSSGSSIPPR